MTKDLFLLPCVQRPAEDFLGLGSHFLQCMCSLAHSQKLVLPLLIMTWCSAISFCDGSACTSQVMKLCLKTKPFPAKWLLARLNPLKKKSVYLSLSQFNATGRIKHWASECGTKVKYQDYEKRNRHKDSLYLTPLSGVVHVHYPLIFILWHYSCSW